VNEFDRFSRPRGGANLERKSCYDKSRNPPERLNARDVARQIAETLCAMANADGGTLLVGQEDALTEAGTGEITGVDYGEATLAQLRDAGQRLVVPPLRNISLREGFQDGKRLLLFGVEARPTTHHLTDGRCLLRIGDRNEPYSEVEIARIKERQSPYERVLVPQATLDDLDADALAWFAEKVGWTGESATLLSEYNLFDGANLNRAALLLFAHRPGRWHDHTDVTIVRYAGKERGLGPNYRASKPLRIEEPLVRLIERAHKALGEQLVKRVGLRDLFFEEEMEYPEFAWQEAVVNAVAHRDYLLSGAGIEVWLFDDRMEVRSPGESLIPLPKLQAGGGGHYSRSPLLARVLIDSGYMREQGEGIPRIFREMEAADLLPPVFALDDIRFVVTLRNTPVYDAQTRHWLRRFAPLDLSLDQKRVLAFAKAHSLRFTNRDVQKLLRLDIYSARNLIRTLINKRIVRLTEPRGRVYEVVTQLEGEPLPNDLAAVLPLFERPQGVANRDLQAAWGLSRHQTQRRARALVDAGWLELTASRGRGAVYRVGERARNATA
jgi:ATP-dependent DNA helicase RecG